VIRRSTLLSVGEFNVALPHTSDVEMWLRLSAVSDVGRINGVDQGFYRVHPNSMQRTVHAGALFDLVGRREAYSSAFRAVGHQLRDASELESIARRKLAREALDRACRAYDRDRIDFMEEGELVAFAFTTFAGAAELAEWRGLQRRRQHGRR